MCKPSTGLLGGGTNEFRVPEGRQASVGVEKKSAVPTALESLLLAYPSTSVLGHHMSRLRRWA